MQLLGANRSFILAERVCSCNDAARRYRPDPDPFRGVRSTPPLQPLRSLPIWFWTSEILKAVAVSVTPPPPESPLSPLETCRHAAVSGPSPVSGQWMSSEQECERRGSSPSLSLQEGPRCAATCPRTSACSPSSSPWHPGLRSSPLPPRFSCTLAGVEEGGGAPSLASLLPGTLMSQV